MQEQTRLMLVALLCLGLAILLLLAMPFDVGFCLKKDDTVRLRVSIAWAYGLLTKELSREQDKLPEKSKQKKAADKSQRKQRKAGKGRFSAVMAFMRSPGMAAQLSRLAQKMWRQLRVRQLYLHLTFGFDDPADTGQLYGALAPALLLTDHLTRLDLQVQPDFSQPTLLAESRGQLRLVPLSIISVMVSFLLTPTCWRGFVAAARATSPRSGSGRRW